MVINRKLNIPSGVQAYLDKIEGLVTAMRGALAVLACVLTGQVILRGHGIDPAHGYP